MRTCRNILLVAAAALLAANGFCGVGATEAWVANYVSNYVARTVDETARTQRWSENGTNYVSYNGYTIAYEDAVDIGLRISADTVASRQAGITNGLCFALADARTGVFVRPGWVISVSRGGGMTLIKGAYADGGVTASMSATPYASRKLAIGTWFVDASTNKFARVSQTLLQPGIADEIRREAGL